MAVNTAKRIEKTQAILNKMKGGSEPSTSVENYVSDVTKALTWYNIHEDDKVKRKWLNTYLTTENLKNLIPLFSDMPDYEVRQLATFARLKSRDQYIQQEHLNWMKYKTTELVEKYKNKKKKETIKKEDTQSVPVASIQDRIEETARKHAGEFEGAIDDFVINKNSDWSAKGYLVANQVSAPVAKRIGEFYQNLRNELLETIQGDDEQLVEGYSNFSKKELKKFFEFINNIINDCEQQVQTAKANRAPRKRKEISPTKQVSKMKYMKEYPDLSLKSVNATSIIGSSEVWVYNTKYRKIQKYVADNGTISVKGTTLVGFNVKDSLSLTLRKPEEFFKGLSLGKRALNNAIKPIKTKPSVPNGRVNEECILLGAF